MRYDEQLIRRDSGNKHTSSNLCGRGSVTLLQPCPEAVGKPVNNRCRADVLMIAQHFSVVWGPGEEVFNACSAWVWAAVCLRGALLSSPEDPQPKLVTFLLLCHNPAFSLQLHSVFLSSWHFSPFESLSAIHWCPHSFWAQLKRIWPRPFFWWQYVAKGDAGTTGLQICSLRTPN